RPLIQNLDMLPLPARKIRPARYGERGDQYSIDTVYSSRGCIARCTFCANDTMNKSFRPRSPEHFIEELERIHDKHVKRIVKFWDSIFLFDPVRVEQIVELMFKRNLTNFRIITESRSDDVIRCRHLMKELKRIGFEKVGLGIESPDQETFKRLRKGGSVNKNERAIRILQEAHIKVEGFFIIGHPHETREDIEKYPDFAERTGISQRALYFVMTPYPGTQIYREYKDKNLIDSYDWDCYNNYGAVIHLDNLQRDQVRNLLSHCYGSTMGIPYCFKKGKTVPRIIIGILVVSVLALFFYDLQGQNDRRVRNRFMGTFFEAGFGSYRKKRAFKPLSRFFRLFAKKIEIRFVVDEARAFALNFHVGKDTISMEVHPSDTSHKRGLTVTLDDLAAIRSDLDMVDCNAFIVLSQKDLGRNAKNSWRYCPLLFKNAWTLLKFFARIGRRFLFPPRS
ncbi:MAG: B12-binding domain-containing radical SAM protein, partial [Nitrospinales bacterium]